MFSVTSEAAASVSFQTAPPKPARPDPSQRNDNFGALVDSNAPPDTGNDRAASAAQQQSASPRRADDAAANADNARSRDAASPTAQQKTLRMIATPAPTRLPTPMPPPTPTPTLRRCQRRGAEIRRRESRLRENHRKALFRYRRRGRSGRLGVAERTARDDPGRGCDPRRCRVDGCSRCNAGLRQRHGAACDCGRGDRRDAAARRSERLRQRRSRPIQTPPQPRRHPRRASADDTASATTAANTSAATATAKIAVQAAAGESVNAPVKPPATQTDTAAPTNAALTVAVAATAPVLPKITLLKAPLAAPAKTAASAAVRYRVGHIGSVRNGNASRAGTQYTRATTGRHSQAGSRQRPCRHHQSRRLRQCLVGIRRCAAGP